MPRLACVLLLIPVHALAAQTFALSAADLADSAIARTAPRLAAEVLASYRDANRQRFLDNRFHLQLLTGQFADALKTLKQARALRTRGGRTTPEERALHAQYAIYARARVLERAGRPFAAAFAAAFREIYGALDDRAAAVLARTITLAPNAVAGDLRWATPDQTGRQTVSLANVLTFLRVYQATAAYRAFEGLPAGLVSADDARRYTIEKNVRVKTADGATVCAFVVRQRNAPARQSTLLQFTIYADSIATIRDAIRSASNGYAAVVGFSRGKACSDDRITPYVHDARDAAMLIDWIAAQPWSDGRVGMYGGSYSGFTAWAVAKYRPKALKAIMVGAPVAPGIDVPMEGNVFWSFVYQWPFYTMNNRWLDNATYFDPSRWNRLTATWYRTGRPYRELERIDGTPNPGFAEWLAHPTIDAYWRSMIPDGSEYARIDIPVLQTAGYFFGGPGGALHYTIEHLQHLPTANHYLVLGPWDHFQAQRGVVTALGDTASFFAGYVIDSAARIDLVADLRYQWFDHILRGAPRPALLRDRINYQLMGANVWRHAANVREMANGAMRLYLAPADSGTTHRLVKSTAAGAVTHIVNLADRSDTVRAWSGLRGTTIDRSNAVVFVSDPLAAATDVSGLLSGRLELITNKRDFDFTLTPYELTANGEYYQLPPYTSRASHVESLHERRLLTPGSVERLTFASRLRPIARRFGAGSRVVFVIAVIKNSGQQINYGTGKDVSDEPIADAGEPLTIRWLGGSYIDLPVSAPSGRTTAP